MANIFMKCPICKEELVFKSQLRIANPPNYVYIDMYDVDCKSSICSKEDRFWGWADANLFIDEYEIEIIIDDTWYFFTSNKEYNTSCVYGGSLKKMIPIAGFYPITDDSNEEFYKKLVKQILNLKAFL